MMIREKIPALVESDSTRAQVGHWLCRLEAAVRLAGATALLLLLVACSGEGPRSELTTKSQAFSPGAGAVLTSFRADVHGFPWQNTSHLKNTYDFLGDIDFHTEALCGGMAFTALDHFNSGTPIPKYWYPPANGTPLRDFILQRQMDSLGILPGVINFGPNFGKWTDLVTVPPVYTLERSLTEEWPIMRAALDEGRPVVLGLRIAAGGKDPSSLGHQLVAFGYDAHGYTGDFGPARHDIEIFVYDPNHPGRNLTLTYYETADTNESRLRYAERGEAGATGQPTMEFRSFFVQIYQAHVPPNVEPAPVYTDGLVHELVVQFVHPNDDLRGGGDVANLTVKFANGTTATMKNINGNERWGGGADIAGHEYVRFKFPYPVPIEELIWLEVDDTFSGGIASDNWDIGSLHVFPVTGDASAIGVQWHYDEFRRQTGKKDPYRVPLYPRLDYIRQLDVTFTTAPLNWQSHYFFQNYLSEEENAQIEVLLPTGRYQVEPYANQQFAFTEGESTARIVLDRPMKPCEFDNLRVRTWATPHGHVSWEVEQIKVVGRGLVTNPVDGTPIMWTPELGVASGNYFQSPLDWTNVELGGPSCAPPDPFVDPSARDLDTLYVRLHTGGDDLRGGTDNLNLTLRTKNGSSFELPNVNRSTQLPGGSTIDLAVNLPSPVAPCELSQIDLLATFGNHSFPNTGDNWNLDLVEFRAEPEATPFAAWGPKRFTGESNLAHVVLDTPQCPPPELPVDPDASVVDLYARIYTGTEGLDAGTTVDLSLIRNDLSVVKATDITGGAALPSHSAVEFTIPLSTGVDVCDLQLSLVEAQLNGGVWDIEKIELRHAPGSEPFEVNGPKRLQGTSFRSYSMVDGPLGCQAREAPVMPGAVVETVHARIRTGAQGLSSGNPVDLTLVRNDLTAVTVSNFNNGVGFAPNTTVNLTFQLPEPIPVCDLQLSLLEATLNGDTWDLESMELRYRSDGQPFDTSGPKQLQGTDFRSYSLISGPLGCPPAPEVPVDPAATVTTVLARIFTGTDPLEPGATADLWMVDKQNTATILQDIRDGAGFPANSVINIELPLPEPIPLCDLQLSLLEVDLNGDAWDFDRMELRYREDGAPFDISGPKRLENSLFRSYSLIQTGFCPDSGDSEFPDEEPAPPVVCTPGDRLYCFDAGVCNPEGTGCECEDPAHRDPAERCEFWHEVVGSDPSLHCTPGSRADCNQLGQCSSDGSACLCDDPTHWWSSDDCSTWHSGPELVDGSVCTPGDQADCSWMGVCNDFGSACICNDPNHWWSQDNCSTWHSGPDPNATGNP